MAVDLSTCKKGDILISKHGKRLKYICKLNRETDYYDHLIAYEDSNLGNGTRTNDGYVMRNPQSRLETDEDIVEIIYK